MRKYEQLLALTIVGGLVLIALADTLRHILAYLIALGFLVMIFRLLIRDR